MERFVLLLIGGPFLLLGLAFGLWVSPSMRQEAADLALMAPATAAQLSDMAAGSRVLLEGHLSGRNRAYYQGYVAYIVDECHTDSDGDTDCDEVERVTPPLRLNASGGPVQIINQDYDLSGDIPIYYQDPFEDTGLKGEEAVIVLGALAPPDGEPKVRADYIAPGSQADQIAYLRSEATILLILGAIFGLIGAGLTAIGIVVLIR